MAEAQLGDSGSGLGPVSEGWFVVNVRDAHWLTSENDGGDKRSSGADCVFETPMAQFPQFGIRLHVFEPGEPNGLYHAENQQEDFLVLSGECRCSSMVGSGRSRRGTSSTPPPGPSTSSSAPATGRASS